MVPDPMVVAVPTLGVVQVKHVYIAPQFLVKECFCLAVARSLDILITSISRPDHPINSFLSICKILISAGYETYLYKELERFSLITNFPPFFCRAVGLYILFFLCVYSLFPTLGKP